MKMPKQMSGCDFRISKHFSIMTDVVHMCSELRCRVRTVQSSLTNASPSDRLLEKSFTDMPEIHADVVQPSLPQNVFVMSSI